MEDGGRETGWGKEKKTGWGDLEFHGRPVELSNTSETKDIYSDQYYHINSQHNTGFYRMSVL